jgi:hypothetical protein
MVPQISNHGIQSNSQMIQVPSMAQTPSMAEALPIAQPTHANVPTGNTKEPKFTMPDKFDGPRSKLRGFVQHVNFFLQLHPFCYTDDST